MKNRLDEILSLMERVDNIDSQENNLYSEYEEDDFYNGGKLRSPIMQKQSNSKNTSAKKFTDKIKNNQEGEVLFIDMINRIGLYKKSKAQITQSDIENAFVNSIKNRKIFCPQLSLQDLQNEILDRNDQKSNELEIEFDRTASNSNISNSQTPAKLVARYASIYENIRKNKSGRLGQFFELLFGKSPDNSPQSDFGSGDGAVEIKTKHLTAQKGIISITKFGIESISDLFSNDSEVLFSGTLKEQLIVILNERLTRLTKEKNITFDDMVIDVRNSDVSKKWAKRKRIVVNTKLEDGAIITKDDEMAIISIYENSQRGMEKPLATYNVKLACYLNKIGGDKWNILFNMFLEDGKDQRYNRNIAAKVPVNYLLNKVAVKCPTLFIASGEDMEYNVDGWDCESDVYVYTNADVFKWAGLTDDDITLYLIKSGLLKIDIGISTGTFRDAQKIVIDSSLAFDYYKFLNRLITFGNELFSEQQLFIHEKRL